MNILEAIVLGILQGLTEFIPVSSSGHLVLLSKILHIESSGLSFEILLHFATLLAVLIVFKNDISAMIKKPNSRINMLIVVATIFTGIIYIIFKKAFNDMYETGDYIGYGFIFTGIILFLSSIKTKREASKDAFNKMKFIDAVFIGIMQGIAIIPGVSRSGSTIAAGLFRKLSRETAVKFSFFLVIPAILAAVFLDIIDLSKGTVPLDIEVIPYLAGAVAAFISGYFAIRFLVKYILKYGMRVFAWYVVILGTLVILDQNIFKIIN